MSNEELARTTIESISRIITQTSALVGVEKRCPGHSVDDSDDLIKRGEERIANLRHIRQEFEDEMGAW